MIIQNVRLSFVNLFEPKSIETGATPKYSAVILIDKNDKEAIAAIKAEIERAVTKGVTSNKFTAAATKTQTFRRALRDGDSYYEEDPKPARDAFKGHFFLNASNTEKPGVVDKHLDPILDKSEVYSGCYAHVDINFFPYKFQGNAGIGCSLNNVMKTRDGERLDNRQTAQQAFGALAEARDADTETLE